MPFIENLSEFKDRQACEYMPLPNGAGLIFANGALAIQGREFDEPPTDPNELFAHKLAFLKVKLGANVASFSQRRQTALTQAEYHSKGWGPSPSTSEIESLKHQAKEIEKLQTRINELQQSIAPTAEEKQRRNYAEFLESQRSDGLLALKEIEQLPVY